MMELLQEGNKHRSTEQTDANKTSSRSHAMLQICVEQQDRTAGVSTEVAGVGRGAWGVRLRLGAGQSLQVVDD